jgi:ketosteroid isomerase-like protein
MSENKKVVERYMEAFAMSDHAEVLSCLAEDVEWEVPGSFHIKGKADFDLEIENAAFEGSPAITITRIVEDDNVVVVEGSVHQHRTGGGVLNLRFCDVFVLSDEKIARLVSYLMEIQEPGDASAEEAAEAD